MATPAKKSHGPRRELSGIPKFSENIDPNVLVSLPCRWPGRSPAPKTAKSTKVARKTPVRPQASSPSPAKDNIIVTPKKKKFATLHKGLDSAKRLPAVPAVGATEENAYSSNCGAKSFDKNPEIEDLEGISKARAMRRLILEEAMSAVPEQGAGRVMYLVKTFDRVLSIRKEVTQESNGEVQRKVVNWALPGLQFRLEAMLCDLSSPPISSSRELLAAEDLEGDCSEHSSLNCKGNRLNCESDEFHEGRMGWGNSINSSGRIRNKRLKVKSLQPFKSRTEHSGKFKEEQFIKTVKEMLFDEERKCNPISQALPWTSDASEIPKKPPVKESTEPKDIVLRSDACAVERAEFDVHVAERTSCIEQIKMERARLQKLEEEEIRRRREPCPCLTSIVPSSQRSA